jgi:hypothetical protein
MNTTTAPRSATTRPTTPNTRTSPLNRFLRVVARPRSYANIAYLLLGLPLGVAWFTIIVTAVTVSASLLVVALLGIPMLWSSWYLVRVLANAERGITNALLGTQIPYTPLASDHRGNPWVRLRRLSREAERRRELGYLVMRLPVGVATFAAALTALTMPVAVAYAPISARFVDDSFGDWFWGAELHDFASSSPWSWALVPVGVVALVAAFHLLDTLAAACGRWAAAWLGGTTAR